MESRLNQNQQNYIQFTKTNNKIFMNKTQSSIMSSHLLTDHFSLVVSKSFMQNIE